MGKNKMNFAVVTTFHRAGYEKYGQRMIQTFIKNWPSEVKLYVYAEDCQIVESAPNLIVKDLHGSSLELVKFKEIWKNVPKANGDVSNDPIRSKRKDAGKGFKWDAVRFAHKVYAIFDCARNTDADILFWMDADTVCHSPIALKTIKKFCPEQIDLGYLGREGKYSECGLYSLNLQSDNVRNFLKEFQRMYDDAESGIFTLADWHDSFVFDAVRTKFKNQLREFNWSAGIISGEGHPLINSECGAYLDHLKGDRKSLGRSKSKDLKIQRSESYWN
jgi:hypothetical protein